MIRTRLGWFARERLLEIIATIVCGRPVFRLSACTINAGRRFAVRRSELVNSTRTTSLFSKSIVNIHLGAIPVFREGLQTPAQVRGLGGCNSNAGKIDLSARR